MSQKEKLGLKKKLKSTLSKNTLLTIIIIFSFTLSIISFMQVNNSQNKKETLQVKINNIYWDELETKTPEEGVVLVPGNMNINVYNSSKKPSTIDYIDLGYEWQDQIFAPGIESPYKIPINIHEIKVYNELIMENNLPIKAINIPANTSININLKFDYIFDFIQNQHLKDTFNLNNDIDELHNTIDDVTITVEREELAEIFKDTGKFNLEITSNSAGTYTQDFKFE